MLPSIKKKKNTNQCKKNWHLERKEFTVTPAVTSLRFPWHRSGSIYTSFNNELSVSPCSLSAYFRGMGWGRVWGGGGGGCEAGTENLPAYIMIWYSWLRMNEAERHNVCISGRVAQRCFMYQFTRLGRGLCSKGCQERSVNEELHVLLCTGS